MQTTSRCRLAMSTEWVHLRTRGIDIMEAALGVDATRPCCKAFHIKSSLLPMLAWALFHCLHDHSLSKVILLIYTNIFCGGVGTANSEGSLGLSGLGLLAALVGNLLLPLLLVTEGSQGTGELLDLFARHLTSHILGEVLQEEAVVGLLGVGRDEGSNGGAELLELRLGGRVEDGQLANVDGAVGVLGIDSNRGGLRSRAAGADTNIAKHVGGVPQIGVLLSLTESFAALSLGLLLVGLAILGLLLDSDSLVLGNALGLGLLCSGGGSNSLGLGLGGLLLLLTLDLGVFGGIPRV